jgi:CubicO group peptidase (beta-lactamase class C family)
VEITSQPDTTYAYSNAGADLMGHILEVIYDKDIDAIFSDNLFGPSQMENSGIHLDQTHKNQVTKGYWMNNTDPSPNQLNTLWGTGGGAKSSIIDLLKFVALQLDDANPISQASKKVLFEGEKLLKVGYFWRVWDDKYGRSFNHHGGTPGTQNWLFVFPKYDLGITIITNQSGPKTPGKLSTTAKKLLKSIVKA